MLAADTLKSSSFERAHPGSAGPPSGSASPSRWFPSDPAARSPDSNFLIATFQFAPSIVFAGVNALRALLLARPADPKLMLPPTEEYRGNERAKIAKIVASAGARRISRLMRRATSASDLVPAQGKVAPSMLCCRQCRRLGSSSRTLQKQAEVTGQTHSLVDHRRGQGPVPAQGVGCACKYVDKKLDTRVGPHGVMQPT
jgi:hypothetical protein